MSVGVPVPAEQEVKKAVAYAAVFFIHRILVRKDDLFYSLPDWQAQGRHLTKARLHPRASAGELT